MLRRLQLERKVCPSAVDSQRIKKTSFLSLQTGMDGNKKINGRKRHLAVDGFAHPIVLANISDNEAGKTLADRLQIKLQAWSAGYSTTNRLALIPAEKGYKADFIE